MYKFDGSGWYNLESIPSKSFVCWNCNNQVASSKGYKTYSESKKKIFICPHCEAPNSYDAEGRGILLPLPGKEIVKLPENLSAVYSEIRKCIQFGCFNGAIMLMRKLIMHIAVEEGAEEGKRFVDYIDYLCVNHIVPPKSKNKADSIRGLGNDTNHSVENRTQTEAQNCFEFMELLLKVNYEFADEVKK